MVASKELNMNTMTEDIGVPELVDIDYGELKKFYCPKKAGLIKKYKDGLIAFCNEKK